jgi:tRNA1Val (adenine37-N6)-methyltransferase
MPNPFFKFKEFTIHQDQCAMKVCTDSCILGAWFAAKTAPFSQVLDIGSGTGLLMLMIAQKTCGTVHGIELDLQAYKQLKENTEASKWHSRCTVFPGDVRSWSFSEKYDFIITNPPFFEGSLTASTAEKNLARHSSQLSLEELLRAIDGCLKPSGSFGILLPYDRAGYFEKLAVSHLFYPREKLFIRQTPAHDFFRVAMHFSHNPEKSVLSSELCIQDENRQYTLEFKELMQDYYLHFPKYPS